MVLEHSSRSLLDVLAATQTRKRLPVLHSHQWVGVVVLVLVAFAAVRELLPGLG